MTTSSRNYNYLALRGAPVDDMEFVEQFGLDPSVAYTSKLNDVMLEKVYNDCLLYTSPSPRDRTRSRMPSSA